MIVHHIKNDSEFTCGPKLSGEWSSLHDANDPEITCNPCLNVLGRPRVVEPEDPINPSHYKQHDMELIEVLEVVLTAGELRGFLLGAMIKYRWRRHDKGNLDQDMKKSAWYLNRITKGEGK